MAQIGMWVNSNTIAQFWFNRVLLPEIVFIGAALPVALAANSTMEPVSLTAQILLLESIAMP